MGSERSFLAYFRSSIVFLSSGFVILKIEGLQNLKIPGYILLLTAVFLLRIGLVRFYDVKNGLVNMTRTEFNQNL